MNYEDHKNNFNFFIFKKIPYLAFALKIAAHSVFTESESIRLSNKFTRNTNKSVSVLYNQY